LAALGAGFAGVGGLLLFNAAINRLGTSDAAIHKLEANFTKGCVPSCTATSATEPQCQALCSCVLQGLHARYPSNERFARWFHDSDTHSESVKQEVVAISTSCAQAARSAEPTP
jgi:hypothetical protein